MTELVFAIVFGVLLILVVGIGWWTRRGEGRGDIAGVRTIATFAGGNRFASDEERASVDADRDEVPDLRGEGLIQALAKALADTGAVVERIDGGNYTWHVFASVDGEQAFVELGPLPDGDDQWLLSVQDPSSGGPGSVRVVEAVGAALAALGLLDVMWHRREQFRRGDVESGSPTPIEVA